MNRYSKNIKVKIKQYKNYSRSIFSAIEKYDNIVVIAHKTPDFDAYGSQFGIGTYLKDNYPNKVIKIVGESHPLYTGDLYPELDVLDETFLSSSFLAIVVDTATLERASDDSYKKAQQFLKIDHHPNVEPYGNPCFVDTSCVAVSEMLTYLLLGHGKHISKETATYLFTGIVGDSGRFKYSSTTASTFAASEVLVDKGVDITHVYNKLYASNLEDLKVMGYILSNYYLTKNGFVYYIFDDKTQKELNVGADRAKEHVNLFSGIKGVQAWAAITEKKETNEWRVSIRSAGKPINALAEKWSGGGHPQASGASIYKQEDIAIFIQEMDDYLGE